MNLDRIEQQAGHLPAYQIADSVNEALMESANLVITAPPGAGKSTLLPLTILRGMSDQALEGFIHDHLKSQGKILMLEPRRLAARQIAERMAQILGEPVGKTIGYRVRFESKVSDDTRIEVLTEGILTRMLVNDATLEGVSCLIFDEFHERSINSDLALALARQTQEIIRPDLKLIIMSATIDASIICQALQAPLIESKGRMFPIETIYADHDIDRYQVAQEMAATICQAFRNQEGDILAFLPGQGEIMKCEELLRSALSSTEIYPLYGNLSPEKQRLAIAPSKPDERKIVLATPIAETSLTIEGVRIVVDSGLCRKLVYDARTGLSHLETVRISQDMATQRRGRAGRITSGVCYRLWTQTSEHLMPEQRLPEILDADLSSMVLDIAAFGENKPELLPWLTLPPKGNLVLAQQLLMSLNALTPDHDAHALSGSITAEGSRMAQLPCHPRIAKMMISSDSPASQALACDIAALLEEKDPMGENEDSDMTLRLSILRSARCKKNLGRWNRIAQIAQEYRKMLRIKEDNEPIDAEEVGHSAAFCGSITAEGSRMAQLPCHPRIAKMMISSDSPASQALACDIAALLEEKDPMGENEDSDMTLRLSILRSARCKKNLGRWARIAQIAQEYRKMLRIREDNEPIDAEEVGHLIALAYPERIAHATDHAGNFKMSNGNTIFIDPCDSMAANEWLAIASLNLSSTSSSNSGQGRKGRVFLSAPVNWKNLPAQTCENISWDSKALAVKMQQETRIGALVIDSKPIQNASRETVSNIICEAARKDGLSMFDWNESVHRLQQRVAQVAEWHPELEIPDLSTEHLLTTARAWLPFYLEEGGKMKTSVTELKKLNLCEILWNILPYELQQEIDRLAPTHIRVPSGSNIRIDYRLGAEAPVLSVRLQECFGMTSTPTVDAGRQPLLLELLSPGFKPVQLTQDLASFWQGTYFEVRKELKRRYPKHFWPENPLESQAVRGVKRW